MSAWKNPLWRPPTEWKVFGKPSRRPAEPRKIDAKIEKLLVHARLQVSGGRATRGMR